ncbi:cysteine hydrolase [Paralcaligenes ureilyticus]|uniref:Nicotinamidase-related amidase n=1 Tax=Paralcaligenes ureilyticus TaxID=627131 RepID=A0A4V2UZ29_9BURK|nr:cysteine hydrolase [Paralcaligenes ureilyticus]TCT09628.1 nicotinamidase-related amidase [Paralcaligenes ureilyticus]
MATALVLLDIQRAILDPNIIKFQDTSIPATTVEAASALVAAARSVGMPVIHVGVTRPYIRGAFDAIRTSNAEAAGKAPRDILALAQRSKGIEFLIPPLGEEEVIYKIGVSAFAGTRLDQLLRNQSIQEIIVAGAFTHMVVESTVRSGFDLGYRMVVAKDACCAPARPPHENSFTTGIPNFAIVLDNTTLIEKVHKEGYVVDA